MRINSRILNSFSAEASAMKSITRQVLLPRYVNLMTDSARVFLYFMEQCSA